MIASLYPRSPVTVSSNSFMQDKNLSRSSLVISWIRFSGSIPHNPYITPTSLDGRKDGSTLRNCLLALASNSLRILTSSCSFDRAGFRSRISFTCFSRIFLAQTLLAVRINGPVTPKWVNIISPKSSYNRFFPSRILMETFLSDSPCSSFTQSSFTLKGTSDGTQSVTFRPKLSANR